MIQLLIFCLFSSLTMVGFHVAFDYLYTHFTGNDLGDFYDKTNKPILRHVIKPIILCPTCMCSIWGTTIWIIYSDFDKILFVPYIGIVCILNNIISNKLTNES